MASGELPLGPSITENHCPKEIALMLTPRTRRLARRVHRTWNELAYAQRRMFEIRTGLPPAEPSFSISADELERRFRHGSH